MTKDELDAIMARHAATDQGKWILLPPSQGVDLCWHVSNWDDTFAIRCVGFGNSPNSPSLEHALFVLHSHDDIPTLLKEVEQLSALNALQAQSIKDLAEDVKQAQAERDVLAEWLRDASDVTHWMPLPEPPKETE